MAEIFISYSRKDKKIAGKLAKELHDEGWKVFWDRNIEPGSEWNEDIQRALSTARCVIVLWSSKSNSSFWVQGEAANAFCRDIYLPVTIEDIKPPKLFGHVQTLSLVDWVNSNNENELKRLITTIHSRIGALPMHGNLDAVAADMPVTAAHLHLVHSCWRVDKQTPLGLMPYRIHIILYGHISALKRVESVQYQLPGYPAGYDRQAGGPPEKLFELKELANGFSIVQAHVKLKSQPAGHPKIIRLSRFINMSESGPRLLNDFIRRNPMYREA